MTSPGAEAGAIYRDFTGNVYTSDSTSDASSTGTAFLSAQA